MDEIPGDFEDQKSEKNMHRIEEPRQDNTLLNLPTLFDIPVTQESNFDFTDSIIHGDCEEVLQKLPDQCVDLIVTSPPYADQRKSTYGGISPDKYVEWFMPRAAQFSRVLKPTGSFILNIKERVVDGERHTYVLELIMRMRQNVWHWIEEYMWHKKTRTRVNGPTDFAITGNGCCTLPEPGNLIYTRML